MFRVEKIRFINVYLFICLPKKVKVCVFVEKKLFLRSILEIEMACNLFSMKYIVDDWH